MTVHALILRLVLYKLKHQLQKTLKNPSPIVLYDRKLKVREIGEILMIQTEYVTNTLNENLSINKGLCEMDGTFPNNREKTATCLCFTEPYDDISAQSKCVFRQFVTLD